MLMLMAMLVKQVKYWDSSELSFLDEVTLVSLYKVFVGPLLEFSSCVWSLL